jgi:hypothetical protein
MNPPLSPSMKLQLARTRRDVNLAALDNARSTGASAERIKQLEVEAVRLDEKIVELEAAEADSPALPRRKDTDD